MEKNGNKWKRKEADVGNLTTSGCSEKPNNFQETTSYPQGAR